MSRTLTKRVIAFLVALLAFSLTAAIGKSGKVNAEEGVKSLLNLQADAWNRGDIAAFMTGYLESPEISYTSGGVEVWGYDALRKRYEDKYGTSRDTMGKLSFSDLKISDLGESNALCIGHWHLERNDQPTVDGIFSLVLVNTKSGWKVIHDHTSSIQNK